MKTPLLLGSHTSSAGGLHNVFERAAAIGSTALQMFTKSNRTWFDKPITEIDQEQFSAAWTASPIKEVIVHAAYLINIGSADQDTAKKSATSLKHELQRCSQLNINYLVLHPGAYTQGDEVSSITQIAHHLDAVLETSPGTTMILLETMAGQGTTLGKTFEQLAAIRAQSSHKNRIGACLDTCHIFSAGYDISTPDGYEKTMQTFDTILGFDLLKAIHLNDSKNACNSRKDRHEELGKGTIPLETFRILMNDKRLAHVPKILETPSDDAMELYAREIKLLKSFIE